ncbi:MAG TPA: glycosyltransferase family 2 protein [Labilithrix sp.]|nr:glycosyltransferase family 2 protein [Labilithrix sp.]
MRICAVIPTFENAATLEDVVRAVREHVEDVIVVDDGSGPEARAVAERLATAGLARVVFRPHNGGKGAAVKTGLERARDDGFSHALQVDADGQHHTADIPRLLRESREDPAALVLGQPIFDASAPISRRIARKISVFWCAVETLSRRIGDPLCGFRVYPVAATLDARARGNAMDFDPEVAVRLAWAGHPVRHVPTRVRYVPRDEGGVSHYRLVRDTMLISVMHATLCFLGLARLVRWPARRNIQ